MRSATERTYFEGLSSRRNGIPQIGGHQKRGDPFEKSSVRRSRRRGDALDAGVRAGSGHDAIGQFTANVSISSMRRVSRSASLSVSSCAHCVTPCPPSARSRHLNPHDLDQGCRSAGTKNTSMAFDPRQFSILEVAGVTTIILSALALAGVVYSIW